MVYVLAVASALSNALASILQRMGVEDAPDSSSMHLSLLTHALKRGVWLLGFAFVITTFLMQAVALHLGDLSQVQPILTTELLFLVLLLATWFRFRTGPWEWIGRLAAAGGLAGFLASLNRVTGIRRLPISDGSWSARSAGVPAAGDRTGHARSRWWRAAMFGTAGAVLAFTAALIKIVGNYYAMVGRRLRALADLPLAICGVARCPAENAFLAGPIAASETALALVDPLASIAIGIGLFGDNLRTTGAYGPLEALSLLVMFGGAAAIAHSPLISGMKGDDERYSEMLSLRSRSKRLVEAVPEQVPTDVIEQLPPRVLQHLPPR